MDPILFVLYGFGLSKMISPSKKSSFFAVERVITKNTRQLQLKHQILYEWQKVYFFPTAVLECSIGLGAIHRQGGGKVRGGR